ncbi:arpin-like [Gigantopelta aegis]|uniref:arpin-like n=1 Tax=Gigantopelta aegis TaxID=1735272 RepID=UPI001B88AB6F|nr:arpin-like [Gigantopelta aegis]
MSRIYSNEILTNLPVNNIKWPSSWDSLLVCKKQGNGVILEAVVKGKSRFAITDNLNVKVRYYVFHVKVTQAHRRKFEASGKEIEPNFSETTKVSKGYLNSSYKVEAKGETDRLSPQELSPLVKKAELDKLCGKDCPADCLSFWLLESQLDKLELETDDCVRIKTEGNSPFVFSIGKIEKQSATVLNYAGGDEVGSSWTDKIMNIKTNIPQTPEDKEVEDDEWDD